MKLEEILAQVYPHLPAARRAEYAPLMEDAFAEFEITTKLRLAAVLGQLAVESNELNKWEESLSYSAKRLCQVWPKRFPSLDAAAPFAGNPQALANKVYGGRMGNTGPDDGWKYRGRTPVQLTGRDMYRQVGKFLNLPLEDDPDLVNDKANAFRAVGCFFRDIKHMLNLADQRQFKAVTLAVNGGYTDMETRLKYYERALGVIPEGFELERAAPQTVPVLPDTEPPDVHEDLDDDEVAAAPPAAQPTAAPPTRDAQPTPQVVTVDTPAQSAPVVVAVTQPTATQPTARPGAVEAAQKVQQSASSKVISWFPMIAGPVAAVWLGVKAALDNPFVLAAIVLFVVGGFVVGAWLWNESKRRQAAQQQKLIDVAAATDKQNVVIDPPPARAG
jgi:putative chitinase